MDEKVLLEELSHGNIHLMKIVTQGMLLYLKAMLLIYNMFMTQLLRMLVGYVLFSH